MRAAYLNQAINLLVAILMVPLLLRYLDANEYILWLIFTTFGGMTLQFESAIQIVSVREISREYHSGNAATLQAAIRKAKAAYTTLAACVLVPFLALGLLYLNYIASKTLGTQGNIEWFLFISAYVLNYYFGTNNSIMLGMARVDRYNNITSLTRALNFICTYLLLKLGLSIMGICLSFAISVLVGCVIMLSAARTSLTKYYASQEARTRPNAKFEHSNPSNILKHTLYTLSAFTLYKGGLLIATTIFPKEVIGAYGLTLQANTVLSALALVPVQVWLDRLVSAIALGNRRDMLRELAVTMIAANIIFIAGSFLLVLFGDMLLALIGSKVMLADNISLLLICLAFLVELNIFLLVTFLVTTSNFRFVRVYVTISLIGITLAILITWITKSSVVTLVVLPLGLQTLVCLPMMFRMTCLELATTPMIFLGQFVRIMRLRS